eukprot:scaffold35698_cov63-Attheya_sp.AAC.2
MSNPLFQFARPNVPIHEWELLQFPDIHAFNNEFFKSYDMCTNIIAMAFHNTPHQKMDYFHAGTSQCDPSCSLKAESGMRCPPQMKTPFSILPVQPYSAWRCDPSCSIKAESGSHKETNSF